MNNTHTHSSESGATLNQLRFIHEVCDIEMRQTHRRCDEATQYDIAIAGKLLALIDQCSISFCINESSSAPAMKLLVDPLLYEFICLIIVNDNAKFSEHFRLSAGLMLE